MHAPDGFWPLTRHRNLTAPVTTGECGILAAMSDTLGWVAAIGPAAIIATIGAWRTEATARWQARADPRASFAHFGHGTAVCAPCGT